MINPFQTPFAAIFQNEVRLNSRRVAPYVLMLFSIFNAALWSLGQGATYYGKELLAKYGTLWAINSDYYISHHFNGYALGIFGLPIFAAVIMAEPVRRDFQLEIDALIFSKPISRAHYLLGKFFGGFLVLVCCQASFAATLILLQVFHPSGTVVLPFRLVPYFKHFMMIVVITYLLFAAVYFTVGALTRNPKIVYLLGIAYYPLIASYGILFLKNLTPRWQVLLSPLMLREDQTQPWGRSPEFVDRLVVTYTPIMFANRALVILAAAVCLTIAYRRFRIAEPPAKPEKFSWLNLSAGSEVVYYDRPILQAVPGHTTSEVTSVRVETAKAKETAVPSAGSSNAAKLRNPFHSPFVAVLQNEVLLHSKRVAPYALMILFAANAVLWWIRPAVQFGWATNSDWYIVRCLLGFSFLLGLPIFNAVFMGDPVIRDFRTQVDPLIFSKPVTRAQYLLGKFFGSFFVLVCCQAVFPLTQLVLQAFPTSRMIVLPIRIFPYFKHFFFFLVITHLVLAAVYFTVGSLTRNSKIVYGLAACFYPLFIAYGLFVLKPLPFRWQIVFDPMLLGASLQGNGFLHSAEFLNQYVVPYTTDMIANRVGMILIATVCLAVLYFRFTIAGRSGKAAPSTALNLSTAAEGVYYLESWPAMRPGEFETADYDASSTFRRVAVPEVGRPKRGRRANVNNLLSALGIELHLLVSERSLVVIIPLATFLSTMEVIFWSVRPEMSYSASYVSNIAGTTVLFVIGISVFYTVEALHRDHDLRTEALMWAQPVPNYVFLLSKFAATMLLMLGLLIAVGLITVSAQIIKGNGPIELVPYFRVYFWVMIPNAIFLAATAMFLKVLFRDRYLTYAMAVGICSGLFYLYSQGHTHWLYNPLLFRLWSYPDLVNGGSLSRVLGYRLYILTLSLLFIGLAHYFYPRPANVVRARKQV